MGIPTTCTVCGKSFMSAYGKKRYCSLRCWRVRNWHYRRVPHVTKNCPVCGKSFESTQGLNKKYCSGTCRNKAYYADHKEKSIAYSKAYHAAHKKEIRSYMSLYWLLMREKMETSCEYYAQYRFDRRIRQRLHYEKTHPDCRPYKQNKKMRIPDWAVKGQDVVDHGSVFLSENMSDEQVMAANDFDAQQKAGEERPHQRIKTVFRK